MGSMLQGKNTSQTITVFRNDKSAIITFLVRIVIFAIILCILLFQNYSLVIANPESATLASYLLPRYSDEDIARLPAESNLNNAEDMQTLETIFNGINSGDKVIVADSIGFNCDMDKDNLLQIGAGLFNGNEVVNLVLERVSEKEDIELLGLVCLLFAAQLLAVLFGMLEPFLLLLGLVLTIIITIVFIFVLWHWRINGVQDPVPYASGIHALWIAIGTIVGICAMMQITSLICSFAAMELGYYFAVEFVYHGYIHPVIILAVLGIGGSFFEHYVKKHFVISVKAPKPAKMNGNQQKKDAKKAS